MKIGGRSALIIRARLDTLLVSTPLERSDTNSDQCWKFCVEIGALMLIQ